MGREKLFQDRLCGLRAAAGLSQQRVADGLEITKVGYQNYEYGRKLPSFGVLAKLADFFDVTADYLLGRSDEPRELKKQEPKE